MFTCLGIKYLRHSCNSLLWSPALMGCGRSSHIIKENICYFFKLITVESHAITTLFKVKFYFSFGDAIVLWNALPHVLISDMFSFFKGGFNSLELVKCQLKLLLWIK